MECPECHRPMLEGPIFSRTTYFYCLPCGMTHYTLDGYQIMEPQVYFSDESLGWYRRHVNQTAHMFLTQREWMTWMRTQGWERQ